MTRRVAIAETEARLKAVQGGMMHEKGLLVCCSTHQAMWNVPCMPFTPVQMTQVGQMFFSPLFTPFSLVISRQLVCISGKKHSVPKNKKCD